MMTIIHAFIMAHLLDIIFVAGILLVAGVLWFTGRKKEAKLLILKLVEEAEYLYTQRKAGPMRFNYVMGELYKQLPPLLVQMLPRSTLEKWIEDGLAEFKRKLSE
jgi:hypothetical protein